MAPYWKLPPCIQTITGRSEEAEERVVNGEEVRFAGALAFFALAFTVEDVGDVVGDVVGDLLPLGAVEPERVRSFSRAEGGGVTPVGVHTLR